MHTCPPPIDKLNNWLSSCSTINSSYGHLRLDQTCECDQPTIDALRSYFESAHLDAREYFHKQIGMSLHPDAEDVGANAQYPSCLPSTARRGLFGEVIAGLITESYTFVGEHNWTIPVFLFREHADAEKYLFDLARDPSGIRTVFGRFGSDFLGLSLDKNGAIVRCIVGEAKWRENLRPSTIKNLFLGKWENSSDGGRVRSGKGIWYEINNDTLVPHGMRQLQRILDEYEDEQYSETISSIDRALLLNTPMKIPRSDLIIIAGNRVPSAEQALATIRSDEVPAEYTAGNDLQVVKVVLENGEELIDAIYDSMWSEEVSHVSE